MTKDTESISEELATVGTKTVDDQTIIAPVEKIEKVDENTIRLWYRYPTGEYIPEEFERPVPWNPHRFVLARIIEEAEYIEAETLTNLLEPDSPGIHIHEVETTLPDEDEIEALSESAPGPLYMERHRTGSSEEHQPTTWKAVDPKNKHPERYGATNSSGETSEAVSVSETTVHVFGFVMGGIIGILLVSHFIF